jgi:hypothetical protein
MSESSTINLIRALVGAELSSKDDIRVEDVLPKGCVVAVSRDYASGGGEVARLLAARLRVRCFDKELLDGVVQDAKVPRYLMERLDEQVQSAWDDWAYSVITGKPAFKEDYRRHLVNVVLGIARSGGVILGRGAHLILDPRRAFRVRITGSLEKCAEREAQRRGISMEQARAECTRVNAERAEFTRRLYRVEWDDPTRFDLIVNSDRLDAPAMVEVILCAMRHAGMPVPVEKPVQE